MSYDSPSIFSSPHVFGVCNAGSEKLLKLDIASAHRDLRPAFMRPQLVTWKAPKPLSRAPQSLFARVAGLSIGMFDDVRKFAEAMQNAALREKAWHLDVFPREVPGEGLTGEEWEKVDVRAGELRKALAAAGIQFIEGRAPCEGEWVLDLVLGADAGGKFLAGVHRHTADTHP